MKVIDEYDCKGSEQFKSIQNICLLRPYYIVIIIISATFSKSLAVLTLLLTGHGPALLVIGVLKFLQICIRLSKKSQSRQLLTSLVWSQTLQPLNSIVLKSLSLDNSRTIWVSKSLSLDNLGNWGLKQIYMVSSFRVSTISIWVAVSTTRPLKRNSRSRSQHWDWYRQSLGLLVSKIPA